VLTRRPPPPSSCKDTQFPPCTASYPFRTYWPPPCRSVSYFPSPFHSYKRTPLLIPWHEDGPYPSTRLLVTYFPCGCLFDGDNFRSRRLTFTVFLRPKRETSFGSNNPGLRLNTYFWTPFKTDPLSLLPLSSTFVCLTKIPSCRTIVTPGVRSQFPCFGGM